MRILFSIFLLILPHALLAQNIDWLVGAGSDLGDYSDDLAVDKDGSSYLVGTVYDTADFDSIQLSFKGNGFKNGKTYFARYDSSGKIQWVDTASDASGSPNIAIDNYGNTYAFGSAGDITLPGGTNIKSGSFLINLKQRNGKVEWVDSLPGGFICENMTADKSGNFYLSGYITKQFIIGNDTFKASSSNTALLLKFDSTAAYQWGLQNDFIGASSLGKDVATDKNDNSYFVGTFFDTVKFGKLSEANVADLDNFIVKHDASGNPKWIKVITGDGQQNIEGITVNNGEIFIVGYFYDSVKVGGVKAEGYSTKY